MNEVVFDASVMLALIQHERGVEKVTDELLERSVASTVNLAEVQSKLVKRGYAPHEAWEDTLSAVKLAEPYTSDHARIAGDLITATEKYGLSLGGRSCLALAIALKAPVYTTEHIWRNLKVGVPIYVIR
jgi:PIN domain nuclease of toxin-antitoxin system